VADTPPPLGRAGFAATCRVSRETLDRLDAHLALLARWQTRINLVGSTTLRDPWRRHVLDSIQLLPLIPQGARTILDLGSGAGFPGLVLAICGVAGVTLVERDQRKAAFLREAARITATQATILAVPAERLPPQVFDLVTARALAPLPELLQLAHPFLGPGSRCLFLKGAQVENELTRAAKSWRMKPKLLRSQAESAGFVLQLEGISHAGRRQS
jgi:16S rRNA (guanine527-N7)-methyltransferase